MAQSETWDEPVNGRAVRAQLRIGDSKPGMDGNQAEGNQHTGNFPEKVEDVPATSSTVHHMGPFQQLWKSISSKLHSLVSNSGKSDVPCTSEEDETSIDIANAKYPSKGFVVIGDGNLFQGRDCVMYDVNTTQPKHLAKLILHARVHPAVVLVNNKIHVMGGDIQYNSFTPLRSCLRLDLDQDDDWTSMPEMLEPRFCCGYAHIEGQIYITGGSNKVDLLASCEKFDTNTNEWMYISDMQQKRREHGTVVCNGSLYCIGGKDEIFHYHPLKSCEQYDIKTGEWKKIASLKQARCEFACVELDGMIYALGGEGHKHKLLSSVERYKPSIDKWEYVAPLGIARLGHCACVVAAKIYVIGGCTPDGITKSVEVYDPETNVWRKAFETENEVWGAAVVAV